MFACSHFLWRKGHLTSSALETPPVQAGWCSLSRASPPSLLGWNERGFGSNARTSAACLAFLAPDSGSPSSSQKGGEGGEIGVVAGKVSPAGGGGGQPATRTGTMLGLAENEQGMLRRRPRLRQTRLSLTLPLGEGGRGCCPEGFRSRHPERSKFRGKVYRGWRVQH